MSKPVDCSKAEDMLDQIESLRADDDPAPLLRKALRETINIIKNLDQNVSERLQGRIKAGERKPK